MKQMKKYFGVIAPLVTPVDQSGLIDQDSIEKLFDHIMGKNNFPFVLGTTGEIALNSFENRTKLVKIAVSLTKGKTTLYAGITDNSVATTIETSKRYADLGVDIFVVHLPYFFPLTNELMLKYFETIADNSPTPFVIYNIKSVTHMSIPIDVVEKLSQHPNIVGLKDSERDYNRVEELAQRFKDREDFSLFIGWTNKSSQALKLGFDGIIPNTSNLVPGLFQSLYEAAINGKEEEAMQLQNKAEELSALVQNNRAMTRTIPELKAILNHLKICKPYVLPPLEKLNDQEAEVLIKEYNRLRL